jgi:hypothetical protein
MSRRSSRLADSSASTASDPDIVSEVLKVSSKRKSSSSPSRRVKEVNDTGNRTPTTHKRSKVSALSGEVLDAKELRPFLAEDKFIDERSNKYIQ